MNFTPETGRLLVFIGHVATAIRMNTPYNGCYRPENPDHANDVMWLSDSLHSLWELGVALQGTGRNNIDRACNNLLSLYKSYGMSDTSGKSEATDTFSKQTLFHLHEGILIIQSIRDKASQVGAVGINHEAHEDHEL